MTPNTRYTLQTALIVALGGFLMGFDASVISGVVPFIEREFDLTRIELGWSVASLTLTATIAMMLSGPLSDRLGRLPVLKLAALLFAISAAGCAVAPNFASLVAARMLGGFGVGAALIIAPMYIAEMAPAAIRGRMVSLNQLNIVLGISAAFFSNYLILKLGTANSAWAEALGLGAWTWRWMLGIESVPALVYLGALYTVPESPRWLVMRGRDEEARRVLERVAGATQADADLAAVHTAVAAESARERGALADLFSRSLRRVLLIGILVAVLQQITGINAVFFYAPMIFEQSGVGTDASFLQAVLVGIVNVVFTVIAIMTIDRLGRRPLLGFGLAGIALSMMLLAYGFGSATYTVERGAVESLPQDIDRAGLAQLVDRTYDSDVAFRAAAVEALGEDTYQRHQSDFVKLAIRMNPALILIGILGFVASFAMSLGPVMWVLFSELFPNRLRGLAISFVGLINSAVSFLVQLIFPWELVRIGNAATFLVFGTFAGIGLVLLMRILPETKNRTLEELEVELVMH